MTTEGLSKEIQICSRGSNPLKTIVIVAITPEEIFLTQIVKSFPRVVPLTEIPPFFALHPEFSPLIDRMKAIMKVVPSVRARLVDQNTRIARFPFPPGSGRFG